MRTKLLGLPLVLCLFLTACGTNDPDPIGSAASPTPAGTTTTTSPTPPEDDPTPTPEPVDEGDRAPIVVERPARGDSVTSPFRLTGDANVFEATVSLRLVTKQGRVLVEDFTTATCGSGCRGEYSTRVRFDVSEPTEAVLEVFESSAEDGSDLHKVRVPLTLLP